ncbi:MAG TPA: DUF6531 domain-containing protein, partial [Armatimonadota bacterium]|nr:DUF6531 domain-containing protein [Armatimonadota bacterium]
MAVIAIHPPRRASDRSVGSSKPVKPAKPAAQPAAAKGTSRRDFLRNVAIAGAGLVVAPLALGDEQPAEAYGTGSPSASGPGGPRTWQGGTSIYKGEVNLATGNAHIVHAITGWGGKGGGLSLSLHYSSQSNRTSPLGPKWTHSLNCFIDTTNQDYPIVVEGDGAENQYYCVEPGYYGAPT